MPTVAEQEPVRARSNSSPAVAGDQHPAQNTDAICPSCQQPYTPYLTERKTLAKTCGQKRCLARYAASRRRGDVMAAAHAARRLQKAQRLERALAAAFGIFTVREYAIFERGRTQGFQEGYQVAYYKRQR